MENKAEDFAQRVMELRSTIMHSLLEDSNTEEAILAGLTLFLQAAYWATDHNQEMVQRMTRDCMELAEKMNQDAETVH